MCITKEESYRFGGVLYPTEIEAIEAALKEIGQRIMKEHSAHPVSGLLAHRVDLVKLLTRHGELKPTPIPVDEAPRKAKGEPKGGDRDFRAHNIRVAMDGLSPKKRLNVTGQMIRRGYDTLDQFLSAAPDASYFWMEAKLKIGAGA